MSDLTLEIFMGVVLLGIVVRMCLHGNPRPGFFVAVCGVVLSAAAMIRHLELSDIIVPLVVAALAGVMAGITYRARAKPQPN